MKLIRDFEKLNKKDVVIAGGKGASLGEMTQAGISVPPGFVLLSSAFEKFLEETDLNIEIDSILHSVNHNEIHTVKNASEKIIALILGAEIPKDIADEIQKFFKKLDSKFVAVRSSATAEDSSTASWAGQLESYLNTTEVNLLENVKKCWASLFTPRAIFYRFEKELHKRKISVAVVVQKMVGCEVSGIAFSVHPVTQDKNQLIIEAGLGLGEAIVSGQITPDSYVVKKEPRQIIDKNIHIQMKGLYRSENGGNEWRDILKEQGEKQVLSDKEILELSRLILKIENHFGFPIDIEWAEERDKFYITQSRPITTLHNITKNKQGIFDYIKSQRWLKGSRTGDSILIYSLRCKGENENIKRFYGKNFFQSRMLVPREGSTIRVIGIVSAEKFHHKAKIIILKTPQFLTDKIDEDEKLLASLIYKSKKIKNKGDLLEIIKDLKKHYFLFFFCFSLGVQLFKNKSKLKDKKLVKNTLKIHDIWRNAVFAKEMKILDNLDGFLNDLARKTKLKNFEEFYYLTITEFEKGLRNSFGEKIKKKIAKRKNGFAYVSLKGKVKVIENPKMLKKLEDLFQEKTSSNNVLKGIVAFKKQNKLTGMVKIIKNPKLKFKKTKGIILVAVQTSPDFIPIIKNFSGIITDEGGVTCHAAIIAREFKIPCIVGTKTATQILKDNDIVEIDTSKGTIKINR